ncbi:MmgE/PrpD family protein [Roseivivax sp. GX 12232]|uniref:MmgE/PrpD family protein n=1 Tax=Roseivivax sp. GX 12232 TaxID=2900547 RepID=UPI001E3559E7|nr:MmgE/PrpD family protein [Roseivivax sp. GX 12232]MCE0506677.1 MmgE/PrpD family protein [Roseivivax sp. GX 12232]
MTSLAQTLARFATGPAPRDEDLARIVTLSLFDWAAVGLAGRDEPVARAALRLAGTEPGGATLFGGGGAAPRAAALANGAVSHALDYDDTHFGHIGHPSVAVMPAALALAETRGASGGDLLAALGYGLETACRIGDWLGRAHYEAGFHQTGTSGAFGAAVAAGRLIGLDAAGMEAALALTATRAAGLKSQFGTMGKPLNAGFAAEVGVTCALLAEAGAGSAAAALEGPQGFGPTHAGEARDAAFEDLGTRWVFPAVSYKFHACCHGLHAMLEALRELTPGLETDTVEALEVTTHPRWLKVCNQPSPETGLGAKFSYRVTAAMALAGVDTAALESYSAETCQRPDIQALRDRVQVRTDEGLSDTEAHLRLRLSDGAERTARYDLLTDARPEETAPRLRAKAEALLGAEGAGALWQAVEDLPGAGDVSGLAARMGGG